MSIVADPPLALVELAERTIVRNLSSMEFGIPLTRAEYVVAETTCAHDVECSPAASGKRIYLGRLSFSML